MNSKENFQRSSAQYVALKMIDLKNENPIMTQSLKCNFVKKSIFFLIVLKQLYRFMKIYLISQVMDDYRLTFFFISRG